MSGSIPRVRPLLLSVLSLLAAPALAEELSLQRAVVTGAVTDRNPTDERARYEVGETVWIWLRIANPERRKTKIRLEWRRDGAGEDETSLDVGAGRSWRTWGRRKLRRGDAGHWTVDVMDGKRRLGRVGFAVGAGAAVAPAAPPPSPPRVDPAPPPAPKQLAVAEEPAPPPAPRQLAAAEEPPPDRPRRPPPDPPPAPEPRLETVVVSGHTPPPEPPTCRALVNLRVSSAKDPGTLDEHVAVDVSVRPDRSTGVAVPGLVVRDGTQSYVLRMVRRDVEESSRHGKVRRRWDLLLGAEIPDGAQATWHGYPATIAPPAAGEAGDRHEANLLRVVSVLGPYVGVLASLQGASPQPFDHSRYATIRAPGRVIDPTELFHDDLPALARRLVRKLHLQGRAPDPKAHDYRRSALRSQKGVLSLSTLMSCCTWEENHGLLPLDLEVGHPTDLRPFMPSTSGPYVAPDACGRITLRDGRLVAGHQEGPLKLVAAPIPKSRALLGVTWIPGTDRFDPEKAAATWRRLGRR